jgi:hypothetical protein
MPDRGFSTSLPLVRLLIAKSERNVKLRKHQQQLVDTCGRILAGEKITKIVGVGYPRGWEVLMAGDPGRQPDSADS